MSMSSHIVGFRPPDERWKKMKAIYDACLEAQIPAPIEVINFFNYTEPDNLGVEVEIKNAVTEYNGLGRSGFDVDISKLPKDIKFIRFFNSW